MKILLTVALLTVFVLIAIFFLFKETKKSIIQGEKNATPKEQVADCSRSDEVCVFENGKMVVKKIAAKDIQGVKVICPTDGGNCPTPVPPNFNTGIAAIRVYTNNPTLKLVPLKTNVQTNSTWYCTENNECWAVDNISYEVLQKNK